MKKKTRFMKNMKIFKLMNLDQFEQSFLNYILSFVKSGYDLVRIKQTNKYFRGTILLPDINTRMSTTIKQYLEKSKYIGNKLVVIKYAEETNIVDLVSKISHTLQKKPGFQCERKKTFDANFFKVNACLTIWDINASSFFGYNEINPTKCAIPLESIKFGARNSSMVRHPCYYMNPEYDVMLDTKECALRILDNSKLPGCSRDPDRITILLTKSKTLSGGKNMFIIKYPYS